MPLSLLPHERSSFDGAFKVKTLFGPLTLFRLCGKSAAGAVSNPYGRFWFNERFFWSMIDVVTDSTDNTAQLNHYLRFVLREFTAVCHDWNSFGAIYRFDLPAQHPVEVAVGRIAPQPFYSPSDPLHRTSLPHEVLMGGEFQYILDLEANPKLKRYVQGPRPLWVHGSHRA